MVVCVVLVGEERSVTVLRLGGETLQQAKNPAGQKVTSEQVKLF